VSEDERPGEERGQDELITAFAALGGPLTRDEFRRMLGSDECRALAFRLAALLLDGDNDAAGGVARDSLAAMQHAWSHVHDPGKAQAYLCQAVLDRSRSVRLYRAADGPALRQVMSGVPGTGFPARAPRILALRGLPDRQREAVVLCKYAGLSEEQAAEAMRISIGAVRSHLARGMSSFYPPSGQE